MKIRVPKGQKTREGKYFLFLPDVSNPKTGQLLEEEAYVQAYLARVPSLPRCADPRCNRAFEPTRDDQLYCDSKCNARHRAREYYRSQNALPADAPVDRSDEQDRREAEIREGVRLAKLDIDHQQIVQPERLPDGKLRMLAVTKRLAGAPTFASLSRFQKYDLFARCLELHGFRLSWDFGFADEPLEELFNLYCAQEGRLDREQILPQVDQEAYQRRLADERATAPSRVLRPRCAGDLLDAD